MLRLSTADSPSPIAHTTPSSSASTPTATTSCPTKPEADADVAASARTWFEELATERKLLVVPANEKHASTLAAKYANESLGELVVSRAGGKTTFDFGEWKSEVATKENPDGSVSFVTIVPGMMGIELVVGSAQDKRSLILRDAQHEYVFVES